MKSIGSVDDKLVVEHDNFDEYLSYIKDTPIKSGNGKQSKDNSPKPKWDLNAGFDGAMELARKGWPEGLKKINRARQLIDIPEHSDQSMQMRSFNAVSGDEVDVGLYLSGEPECMTDYQLKLTPSYGKVAKIIVNCVASCSVKAATMQHRGAAACILIDALESSGVRCEVWMLPTTSEVFYSKVLVKKADQHVEPDRMAFMLSHPAVLRRLAFKEQETYGGKVGQETKWGYGTPTDLPKEEREEDGTIYFGRYYSGYDTEKDMVKTTNSLLAKYVETDLAAA